MNRKILFILLVSILVVGCGRKESVSDDVLMKDPECEAYEADKIDCKIFESQLTATIETQPKLKVTPSTLCAKKGATINWNIEPEPAKSGTVAVIGKDLSKSLWLMGLNSSIEKTITVKVLTDVPGIHEYKVRMSSGKCLDPRVHVEN